MSERSRSNTLEGIFLAAIDARNQATGTVIPDQGYLIDAPNFTTESFRRLVDRATAEGVTLEQAARPGVFTATRAGSPHVYTVTRASCSCTAGQLGQPSKHRAAVVLFLAIKRPRGP